MKRHNGFTCPKCGSHMFGTHTHYVKIMGDKFPDKARVGHCRGVLSDNSHCTFEWDRADEQTEQSVMHQQTLEEHMAELQTV